MITRKTQEIIDKHLLKAREKHPMFTTKTGHALLLALEELGEAIKAYNTAIEQLQLTGKGTTTPEINEEVADCIAVLIRFLNGECSLVIQDKINSLIKSSNPHEPKSAYSPIK